MELFQKFRLVGEVKWYYYKFESVVENDSVKMLWDFNMQTDHIIQHRRPEIFVLYKTERKCHLIDIAVPANKKIEMKEQEKIDSYIKLRREVKKIWNLSQVMVVPVAIGSLGVTSKRLKDWLKKLDVNSSIKLFQKTTLLGTVKIERLVLET